MAGEPNELPEGGEGGGGGILGWWPGRPIPSELPPDYFSRDRLSTALVSEILRVRNRLHQIENRNLVASILGRRSSVIGGPNELPIPEGGEGGEGGIGPVFPGENPAELPIIDQLARQQMTQLATRIGAFESRIVGLLGNLQKEIESLKKR
jgi:hypothetical protein